MQNDLLIQQIIECVQACTDESLLDLIWKLLLEDS